MALDPITAVLNLGGSILDKIFPDKEAADKAKIEFIKLQQEGGLKEIELGMSVMLAEAQSSDKWTSRARPSFLYVMYIIILCGIPMGIFSAFSPEIAQRIGTGLQYWLGAIPDKAWDLFTFGFLGYSGLRTFDKVKGK